MVGDDRYKGGTLGAGGGKAIPEASGKGLGGFPGMEMMSFVKKVPFSASDGVSGGLEEVPFVINGGSFVISEGSFTIKEGSFVINGGLFTANGGSFVINEGLFMINKGPFVTSEGSFTIKEGLFVTSEGLFMINGGLFITEEGSSKAAGMVKKRQEPTPVP